MSALFETGFFSRNKPAWHGLGTVLAGYPENREEARRLAGHDWEPVLVPAFKFSGIDADGNLVHTPGEGVITGEYVVDEGFNRAVRSDNGFTLAHPRDSYPLIGNTEMYDILEVVLDQTNIKYETGGVLDKGRAVWLLVRLDEPLNLPGDPSENIPYLALLNRHDGQGACKLMPTVVRIVCANTFKAAELLGERSVTTYSFRHTKNWRDHVEEVRDAIRGVRVEVKRYEQIATDLLGITVTPELTKQFVNAWIPDPVGGTSKRQMDNIRTARTKVAAILDSPTTRDVAHTAYGWVQAAGEYADHVRKARTPESRFNRAMVYPEPLKRQAYVVAREVAGV